MQPDSPATIKPPLKLALRAARPADAEALAAMMNLPGFRWGTTRIPFHSSEEVRSRLEAAPSGGRHLVAIVDGDLVGSASLDRPTGRRSHIGRIGMGVHDAWVGRRIGSALMAALTDLADNWLDLKRLELEVNVDNVPALVLYRRLASRSKELTAGTSSELADLSMDIQWRASETFRLAARRHPL